MKNDIGNVKKENFGYVYSFGNKIIEEAEDFKNNLSTLSIETRDKHSFANIGACNGNAKPLKCLETDQVFGSVRECKRTLKIEKDLYGYLRRCKPCQGLHFSYISEEEYFEKL